jgi:hypothetical protein
VIPKDALHHAFGSPTSAGWWYPTIGPSFIDGQVESHWQSATYQGLGTSMKTAMLEPADAPDTTRRHLVVGTNGGFVYAIEPGAQVAPGQPGDKVTSRLAYATPDLGSFIVGLDCGDLTGDGIDEIVCGCWIDDGSYVDWSAAQLDKNRGKLYVIDTTLPPVVGGPGIKALTGDASFPSPGDGIGAAVFGVKIDDVDNDGTKEIWCTDQFHVYLFHFDATSGLWKVATRSADLGCFPGSYNNLFPFKNAAGETVKLVVVSPGYVMEFEVDPSAVP